MVNGEEIFYLIGQGIGFRTDRHRDAVAYGHAVAAPVILVISHGGPGNIWVIFCHFILYPLNIGIDAEVLVRIIKEIGDKSNDFLPAICTGERYNAGWFF